MNRVLLKYSGNTVYVVEEDDIDFQSVKDKLEKKGFQVVRLSDAKSLLSQAHADDQENKEDYTLHLVETNQPSQNLMEHFSYLNLTVEWLMSILSKFKIGFCVFNKESYLAYNSEFENITRATPQVIKNTNVDELFTDANKKALKTNIIKCLNKEIGMFCLDIAVKQAKKGEKLTKFFCFPLTVEGNSLGTGFLLNEKDHKLDDPEAIRLNKLIINELNQAFRILSKVQSLDVTKVQYDSKEKIINELSEEKPDYSRINLSDREYEVLNLIYKGYTNQQIADELYISKRTVDFHRSNLLGKTNSRNTADLIRFAVKNHLIIE